jgi:hypothetical protein
MTAVPFPDTRMAVDQFALWMHFNMPPEPGKVRWHIVAAVTGWSIQFVEDSDATLFSLLWQND